MRSGYQGRLFLGSSVRLEAWGDILLEGGEVQWGQGLDLHGDLKRTGGTWSGGQTEVRFLTSGTVEFDAGPNEVTARYLFLPSPPGPTVNLKGSIRIVTNGSLTVNGTLSLQGQMTFNQESFVSVLEQGQINIMDGSVMNALMVRTFNNAGLISENGSGKILRKASAIGITSGSGSIVSFAFADPFYVTLLDDDANLDGSHSENTYIVLRNLENGDEESLVQQEVGLARSEFRNVTGFPTAPGPPTSGNGIFEGSGRDRIEMRYQDPQDPDDVLVIADFDVRPTNVVFPAQGLADGASSARTVTIENTTGQELSFTSIQLGSAGSDTVGSRAANAFSFVSAPSLAPLAPGESRTVQVRFDPDGLGLAQTELVVVTDNAIRAEQRVAIEGLGVPAVQRPTAVMNPSGTVILDMGEDLTVSAIGSFDPDGTVVTYHWDFGDGTVLDLDAPGGAAPPAHTYADPGAYTVTLTVTDNHGATSDPVTLEVLVPGGASDENLYLSSGSFSVNLLRANADSFTLSGALNPRLLPAVLNGLELTLVVNGTPLGSAQLDAAGRFATPRGTTPAVTARIVLPKGTWSWSQKSDDLDSLLDLPVGHATKLPHPLDVRLELSGGTLPADLDFANRPVFALTQKAGVSAKGVYKYGKQALQGGVFLIAKATATEQPATRGGGHIVALSGMLAPASGMALELDDAAAADDVRIVLGDAAEIGAPFGAFKLGGTSAASRTYTLDKRSGQAPAELKSLAFKNATRSFTLATSSLQDLGLPGAGGALTAELPVVLELETPAGTLIFETLLRLRRSSSTSTKWGL
ncbi:MAG: PKD domain-containing protein [Planctomycetes bacterium]|nr:PKD domain-containing protein [Planctomycetota bacterium]